MKIILDKWYGRLFVAFLSQTIWMLLWINTAKFVFGSTNLYEESVYFKGVLLLIWFFPLISFLPEVIYWIYKGKINEK